MTTILQSKDYSGKAVLYMAMELSNAKWKLGFSNGSRDRSVTIIAGDWEALSRQIGLAKEKLHLPEDCPVISCYEHSAHIARIKSLLIQHGVRTPIGRNFPEWLETIGDGLGNELGPNLKTELVREYERLQLVKRQIKEPRQEQKRRIKEEKTKAMEQIITLMQLRGVGPQSSWILVMEFFVWRKFKNRRELAACAGLTPTPYDSGSSQREQGISKAGSRRVRSLMVELGWLWLRYQPDSKLSHWFHSRFGIGKRFRRVGIVALARKLLIALWRYLEKGVIPEGAVLKAS
uniref:Transposase IS116/IS110/IS902 family protein n=1 Tax=Candidatus Kentrum sp. SD TaxID=2126332 RepID=A0A450Z8F2_9GAMM|nr:MAG: Transposase IS116/IS110/IS902 family protein [Candidatus Kentron sp. SD]VFK50064.1 MAG: Transposase IS116/IS110/IS902 family protein [Candidatus Kentron sp. SD]